MVKWLGGRSGFKTARDLLLFAFGAGGMVFHLATNPHDVQVPVLMFFGGLMGAPYVLAKDEGRKG